MFIRKVISSTVFMLSMLLVSCSDSKHEAGELVITKIEAFKMKHGRLPNNLNEVGINEDEAGPIYYQTLNDSIYEVYYGLDLGTSMTYKSDTKVWKKQ